MLTRNGLKLSTTIKYILREVGLKIKSADRINAVIRFPKFWGILKTGGSPPEIKKLNGSQLFTPTISVFSEKQGVNRRFGKKMRKDEKLKRDVGIHGPLNRSEFFKEV